MITQSEARQRCAVNAMAFRRVHTGEYRVSFPELTGQRNEATAYYTDDIEDAVLTAGAMRRRAGQRAA